MVGSGEPLSPGQNGVVLTPGNQTLYVDDHVKAGAVFSTLKQDNSTTTTTENCDYADPWNSSETTTTTGAAGIASKSTKENMDGDTSTTVSVGRTSVTTSNESDEVTVTKTF